jgi:hypothetical protein
VVAHGKSPLTTEGTEFHRGRAKIPVPRFWYSSSKKWTVGRCHHE